MKGLLDLFNHRHQPMLVFGFFLITLIAPPAVHAQETRSETTRDVHSMSAGNPVPGSPEDIAYSEFMHHLNGAFVFLLGILAILERRWVKANGFLRWGWPALFLISGVYLMVQSDQDGWPIGEKGFIESMRDPTIFQHKIAASILLLLGLSELLLRTSWKLPVLGWVFPTLAVSAGFILFFHGHAGHHAQNIYIQHLFMGGTALAIGVTRGLSNKFKAGESLWPLMILLLGLELLLYTE